MGFLAKRKVNKETAPIYVPCPVLVDPYSRRDQAIRLRNAFVAAIDATEFGLSTTNVSATRGGGLVGSLVDAAVSTRTTFGTEALVQLPSPLNNTWTMSCFAGVQMTGGDFNFDWGVEVAMPKRYLGDAGNPSMDAIEIATPMTRSIDGKLENISLYRRFKSELQGRLQSAGKDVGAPSGSAKVWTDPAWVPYSGTIDDLISALDAVQGELPIKAPLTFKRGEITYHPTIDVLTLNKDGSKIGIVIGVRPQFTDAKGTTKLPWLWATQIHSSIVDAHPALGVFPITLKMENGGWLGIEGNSAVYAQVLEAVAKISGPS